MIRASIIGPPVTMVPVWLVLMACIANVNSVVAQSSSSSATASSAKTADRPNVLIFLADDLGYSDLGCYGGEIETPNLDAMANQGLRFTQFYNSGRCWPTRASLLTGYFAQQVRRDKLPGIQPSGGQGVRPAWAPLLPNLIRDAGYHSFHVGKWHVDGMPVQQGFDQSYYLGDQARFFSPKRRFLNDQKLDAIPRGTDYYATIDIADRAIEMLEQHHERHAGTPFFGFVAFTAPHFPLHALPEDIEKYRERYRVGWDELRQQRWQRIREMGVVDDELSAVEFETGAPYKRPKDVEAFGPGEMALPMPWNDLNEEQQEFQATKMAIHAAMIDRMDQEIGRIVVHLREHGLLDNTLILFLSDNGCSSELMIRDDGHDPQADAGSADTHLCLGPGWSTCCNTPFRKHKSWVHEGGIATPLIVHWPTAITKGGSLRHQPSHIVDIVPTVLELAQADAPMDEAGPGRPGTSLVQAFASSDHALERSSLWWSHENHRAIRVGDWKAVKTANTAWELYDLGSDRAETRDLGEQNPERLKQLVEQWQAIEDQFIRDLQYQ